MSHFVKGRDGNGSKAGEENVLGRKLGRKGNFWLGKRSQRVKGISPLPAHEPGDTFNISLTLIAELSAWHTVGILQACAEKGVAWGSGSVLLEVPTPTTRG